MKYLGNRRRAIRWPFWCPEAALPFLLIDCYQKIQAVNNFKLQGIKKSTSSTRLPNLNNTKNVILQQQRTETNFAPKRGNAPHCNKSANGAPSCEWTGEGGTLQRLWLLPIFNPMRGVGGRAETGVHLRGPSGWKFENLKNLLRIFFFQSNNYFDLFRFGICLLFLHKFSCGVKKRSCFEVCFSVAMVTCWTQSLSPSFPGLNVKATPNSTVLSSPKSCSSF